MGGGVVVTVDHLHLEAGKSHGLLGGGRVVGVDHGGEGLDVDQMASHEIAELAVVVANEGLLLEQEPWRALVLGVAGPGLHQLGGLLVGFEAALPVVLLLEESECGRLFQFETFDDELEHGVRRCSRFDGERLRVRVHEMHAHH